MATASAIISGEEAVAAFGKVSTGHAGKEEAGAPLAAVSVGTDAEAAVEPRLGEISLITPDDEEAVARFYAGFEREARSIEFWRQRLLLWWRDNPAYCEDWPRGVKMIEGGRIVGVISAIPTRIRHEGRETIAASLTTWRVEKSHRSGSLVMFEAVLAHHARRTIIDGTPTPDVVHILKHFGFHRPHEHFTATRFVCNWWRVFMRGHGGRPPVLGSSRIYLDGQPAAPGQVEPLVDALWARTRHQFDMVAVRDSAHLQWFCCFGRLPGRFGVVITDGAGAAIAVAVGMDMGGGVAWLVDVWCDFSQPAALAAVVARSRWHTRRLGFHSLWVPHFHPAVAAACGPVRSHSIPMSAFFKSPASQNGKHLLSYWPVASGDFGV